MTITRPRSSATIKDLAVVAHHRGRELRVWAPNRMRTVRATPNAVRPFTLTPIGREPFVVMGTLEQVGTYALDWLIRTTPSKTERLANLLNLVVAGLHRQGLDSAAMRANPRYRAVSKAMFEEASRS